MKTRNFILSIFMMMFCSFAFGQNWGDFNYHNYPNNMTVNAVLSIDGELQSNPNLTIAPYCGDERRGEPVPAVKAVTGKYMACMLIYGNENGDNITFKLYDGECMYDNLADYGVAYEADTVHGDLRNPETINFRSAAKVGDKKYGKLQAAVDAAEGKTVEVINAIALNETVIVDKSTTIDFANKAITADVFPAFRIQGNADVTVKNGNITNGDYVFVLGSSDQTSAGKLTIESGKYVGETTVASVTKGQLNISGGEFDLQNVGQYGYTYLINCIDANYLTSANVSITGGKFYGFNPENNAAEGANTNFCAEGYVASEYTENGSTYYIVEEGGWVAQNTTTGVRYKTLQAAVDACAAGNNTIVLLANNEENVTIKQVEGINVTIDGGEDTHFAYSGTFTIHGNARYEGAETLTFVNIDFTTNKAGHYFIDSNSTASAERYAHNVTVENCNFTATGAGINSAAAMRIRQGFDITINGSTFTYLHSALQAYGNKGITVDGIELNGKNGISAGTSTDVVIDNSTITATGYGVRADGDGAYDVTINGTTTITAEMPVVVRKTTGAYDLSIGTDVTLATTGEYQVIMTTGDDGTYEHPTANATATINSAVTSIFGFEARIGNVYYTTLGNALNAESNENVTLLAPYTVAAGETVVLDLKGKTVVYASDVMGEAMITNNGTLTVKNGTVAYTYTGAADNAYTKGNYTINNYGTLTVEGNVENNTAKMSHASYAINNMSNATTTINSGKVVNAGNYAIRQFASGSNTNTLTINGGEVEGTRAVWMQAAGSNTADAPAIVLNVNGGTLTGTGESGYKLAVYSYSNGNDMKNVAINVTNGTINGDIALTGGKNKTNIETVNISGGRFNGEAGEIYSYGDEAKAIAAITISGGTFNTNDAEKYTEDNGYIFEKNADGTYTVREGVFVAQNITTGKKYESLQAAIDACAAGNNTIVLLADNSEAITIKQVEGINVTIDGAGKKYSSTFTIHGNARYQGEETLTFQNINFTTSASDHIFIDANSTAAAERYAHNVTVKDCSFTATGFINNIYKTALALRFRQSYNIAVINSTFSNLQSVYQAYGNNGITIDNITVENCWNGISAGTSTNVVIKNSNITASSGYGVRADGTGVYDMTIENSSIKAPRPVVVRQTTGAYNLTIGEGVNLTSSALSNKYQVIMTNGDDDTREYPTSQEATATIKSNNVTNIFGFEAKNNNNVYDVYYTALSNAYAKAQDNETITLLRNVELAEIFTIDKAITLDGGNKTLTSAAGRAINIDFAGEVNIQNLTIAGSTGCERGINIINKAGTTNLSNVKVSNVSHYAVHVATSAGAAKVNIENSNLSAWGALAIYGKGSEVNVENTTMLGTNTYTGETNDFSTVQYGAENVTININGGSITAKSSDEYRNQAILSESGNEQYTTSSAGTKVTLNTELKFEGSNTSYLDIELDETIIIKVKADYADELQEEGWATVALTGEDEGLVQVIPAVAKIGETYYATLAKAIAAATAGQTIEFIANITEDVTVNKSVTIDGADFEYTGTMTLNNINVTIQKVAFVKGQVYKHKSTGSNAQVTIKDCSFDGQGLNAYAVNLGGGKNINIENVTAKDYGYGLLQVPSSFSNVSLKNVSISEVYYGIKIDYAGAVSLENVTMTDVAEYGIYDSNYGNKTYTVKNSTISSIEIWERAGAAKTTTFNFVGENTVGSLENSQYAKYVLTDTDATLTAPEGSNVVTNIDGYKVVYENGMYKVVAMVYVAEITGGAKYESLQAAIDAAVTGDEVVILKDLAYSWENVIKVENNYDVLVNVSGKDITLNMNGKTISVDHQSTTDRIYAVVYVENGAGLTVTGNGTIDVDVNNTTPKVAYMFWKRGTTGHLTIENGNYHMDNSEDSMVYSNGDDIVIVKGGTFVLDNAGTGPNHGFPWIFNATGNNQNSIYVIGGTYNYDIRTQYWDAEVNVPSEYTVVDNGNGTWTVVPAQRQTLETGWNWFSSYIADFNGTKGLDMLKSCIGNNGEQIKNQFNSIKWDNDPNYNNGEYFWFGSLEEVSVTEMYMIKTTAPVELVLGGDIVNPAATPITLNDKWTWIGYPVAAAMNVETAFDSINPQDGDIIKTHNGVAQYYANIPTENGTWSGWYGQSLQSMTPGMGYMYYNTSSEAKTLVYPAANANSRAEVRANVTTENNHWAPKASAFANNMNIIAVLESNDMMGEFEVAAFVNGEVRGSARPTYVEPIDAYVLFMTIYGEEGEEVSFKYYDIYSDEEHSINNTVNYSDNAIIGSIREPYMFFANTLGMDEKVANTLSIYPNPTTTNTAISFETTFDMVEVFNSLGAKVAEYRNVDRIEGMEAAGVYVIRVTNDSAVQNCRLIVK